jgi:riboflavin synthase
MFTGIVEELGSVVSLEHGRLRVAASTVLDDVVLGASIAVNGCCLTAVRWQHGPHESWWEADVTDETLARTNLGDLSPGDPVNLERPVRVEDRLGGHVVQGHVDAVGEIVRGAPDLQVRMDPALLRYVVEKGSITVDGVSLTVVDVLPDGFTIALIPHTGEVTTLGRKGPGATVNLEVDVMAKYAERLLAPYVAARPREGSPIAAGHDAATPDPFVPIPPNP